MKYAHLEKDTNKLLGWYCDEIHGTFIQAVYEEKIIQEEQRDNEGNITQEEIKENMLVRDSCYDSSNIPTPNIEVTDEDWQEALNINANCYENGKFIVKDFRTVEEIAQQEADKLVREAKQYLTDTDWIVVKLQEAQLLGTGITEMLTKYSTELTKREECRTLINELGA